MERSSQLSGWELRDSFYYDPPNASQLMDRDQWSKLMEHSKGIYFAKGRTWELRAAAADVRGLVRVFASEMVLEAVDATATHDIMRERKDEDDGLAR
ncbi:MAG: hypothetical protein WC683_03910 [bacterium]